MLARLAKSVSGQIKRSATPSGVRTLAFFEGKKLKEDNSVATPLTSILDR